MPPLPMPSELDPQRRGLAAPRPAGGQDPDPATTARTERRYLWLLILMVALIVGITTIVGIIGMVVVGLGGTT
jgi:hypothetical protein